MNQDASLNILLGVTGAIAAYKTPELVRQLLEKGNTQVRVVMTPNAAHFVAPLALQAVSTHPVRTTLWDEMAEKAMGHIELARWADKILIAPASADVIARLAQGAANDLLTTLCLATQAPIYLAPSMNRLMWENPITQENIHRLEIRGFIIIPPESGEQACGEFGEGRMPEPETLVSHILASRELTGKNILITAGPTIEAIDPVRFISNHSSGKMGYALARAAKNSGANVTLISGPVDLASPAGIHTIRVNTAEEMHAAVLAHINNQTVFISTAAVSDYRPAHISTDKLKKNQPTLTLDLVRTPDILHTVAQLPNAPVTVGFAAETTDVVAHGKQKLQQKNLDMICVNDVSKTAQGFHSDYNAVTVLTADKEMNLPRALKTQLAQQIMQYIVEYMNEKSSIKNNR